MESHLIGADRRLNPHLPCRNAKGWLTPWSVLAAIRSPWAKPVRPSEPDTSNKQGRYSFTYREIQAFPITKSTKKAVARSEKMKKSKEDSNLSAVSMPAVGRGKTVMSPTLESGVISVRGAHQATSSSCRLGDLGLSSLTLSPCSLVWKATGAPVENLQTFPYPPSSRLAGKCVKP